MTILRCLIAMAIIILSFNVNSQCTDYSPLGYGDNEWNVNVYAVNDINLIHETNNFKGYYKQKIDATGNLGVNTTLQWTATNTGKPSQATAFNSGVNNYGVAYQGCSLADQVFTFVHKRKGFPTGNYEIFIEDWDDKTDFYLNDVKVVSMGNYGSNEHALICIYLDANSRLEIRTDNRGMDKSQLRVEIRQSTAALNLTSGTSSCPEQITLSVTGTYIKPFPTPTTKNMTDSLTNSVWTGDNIISGANTKTVTVKPNTTTTYQYSAKFQYCQLSGTTTVTYNGPTVPTNLDPYIWYVMGYDGTNTTSNQNLSSLYYYGYYKQGALSATNHGYKSSETSKNGFAQNKRPSNSSEWNGCTMPSDDNFTYVMKRKGFKCGTYKITMKYWDQNTRVYIDGVERAFKAEPCVTGTCTSFFTETLELNDYSVIEVRTRHNTENTVSEMEITEVNSNTLANNGEWRECPVKGDQWVNFYHKSGRYLGSVRGTSPTADLGMVRMTAYVDAQNQIASACSNVDHLTAVMQRHWVITPTYNLAGVVRLPYTSTEFQNLEHAANATPNLEDFVQFSNQSTVHLSKYSGPTNVNSNVNDNCAGSTTFHYSLYNNNNASPYYYQDFQVPGFSEFWLHGYTFASPLGNEVSELKVNCDGTRKNILFQTNLNSNASALIIEASANGYNWNELHTNRSGNLTANEAQYSLLDENVENIYYRVKTIDNEGVETIHHTTISNCNETEMLMNVYPNPSNGTFSVRLVNIPVEATGISIVDMTGRIVAQQTLDNISTSTTIHFNESTLAQGTYLVKISGLNDQLIKPQHLIIK